MKTTLLLNLESYAWLTGFRMARLSINTPSLADYFLLCDRAAQYLSFGHFNTGAKTSP